MPILQAKAPKRSKHQPNPLDPSELPKMNAALDSMRMTKPEFADMCVLGLNTGMRRGELCALRWCDIDSRAIHVNHAIARGDGGSYVRDYPKNGHRRSIDLNCDIEVVLNRRKEALAPFASDLSKCFVFAYPESPDKFPEPNNISHLWNMFVSIYGFLGVEGEEVALPRSSRHVRDRRPGEQRSDDCARRRAPVAWQSCSEKGAALNQLTKECGKVSARGAERLRKVSTR